MLTSKVGKNPGKAVIVGGKGVGKTAILEQLIYGKTPTVSIKRAFFSQQKLFKNFLIGIAFNNRRYLCSQCRYWKRTSRNYSNF